MERLGSVEQEATFGVDPGHKKVYRCFLEGQETLEVRDWWLGPGWAGY